MNVSTLSRSEAVCVGSGALFFCVNTSSELALQGPTTSLSPSLLLHQAMTRVKAEGTPCLHLRNRTCIVTTIFETGRFYERQFRTIGNRFVEFEVWKSICRDVQVIRRWKGGGGSDTHKIWDWKSLISLSQPHFWLTTECPILNKTKKGTLEPDVNRLAQIKFWWSSPYEGSLLF